MSQFLVPFPESVREIALLLRDRVLAVVPKAHETVWDATNAVSLVYAPTSRSSDGVCHIAIYSKHVNLGFNEGASLPDPEGVLKGTGTHIRHATFREPDDTEAGWIDDYLDAALEVADQSRAMGDEGTTIRVMEGRKRRPGRPAGEPAI
jgi:hypothetical protein